MNIVEVAELLDGREYRQEVDKELRSKLREDRILVIYGASDDIMCLDGFIHDEAYDTIYLKDMDVLRNVCEEDRCPYYAQRVASAWTVTPVWHDTGNPCWTYETALPHTTFEIMEDGEVYCRGIVIDMWTTNVIPS